jgi:hypothetical protein
MVNFEEVKKYLGRKIEGEIFKKKVLEKERIKWAIGRKLRYGPKMDHSVSQCP